MQRTIGTTAAESLNAAACIFLGQASSASTFNRRTRACFQTEAALLIEPAFITMTESEIHTVNFFMMLYYALLYCFRL